MPAAALRRSWCDHDEEGSLTNRKNWLMLAVAASLLATTVVAGPAAATPGAPVDRAPVLREYLDNGTPAPEPLEQVGTSRLVRGPDGLEAQVRVTRLKPGGVYTFWWVVAQHDGTFPDDIFVALGAGAVVGASGRVAIRMNASLDEASIAGFEPAPGVVLEFDELHDPLDALVRVEIAYHGQAADAGDELHTWLSDFWTGAACPPETPNPNPAQPHCPVWFAATHD